MPFQEIYLALSTGRNFTWSNMLSPLATETIWVAGVLFFATGYTSTTRFRPATETNGQGRLNLYGFPLM